MSARLRLRGRLWLERALLVVGVLCLAYYGYRTTDAHQFQREQRTAFQAMLKADTVARGAVETAGVVRANVADSPAETRADARGRPAGNGSLTTRGVVALLEIPRLKLSTPVLSGDDDATLDLAVGHLPDTPLPWEPGNSALAAHRDGLFRALRNIRIGDAVRVRTVAGDFEYLVRQTRVVAPTDLSVLAPTSEQTLTLITCYPFNFVGNAPERFIVHAERVPAHVTQ